MPFSGVYPVRLLYYEGFGGADVEFYSVNLTTGERVLINTATPGAIKAYRRAVYELVVPTRNGNQFSVSFGHFFAAGFPVERINLRVLGK